MPADPQNIIAMLEQELEGGWPEWLKEVVNDIIKILEKLIIGCDAYGVWGSRTKNGYLYSSRNLDWNTNTGIDQWKLVTIFHITDRNIHRWLESPTQLWDLPMDWVPWLVLVILGLLSVK